MIESINEWVVPVGVTQMSVTVIGAGGSGARAYRTGGDVWGQASLVTKH